MNDNEKAKRVAQLIPPGKYDGRAKTEEIELLANENTGNMFLRIPVQIMVGDETRIIEDHAYFSPAAAKIVAKRLYGYGARDVDFERLAAGKWAELGAPCSVEIEHEEYPTGSGTIRHKIKWVNRTGTVKVAPNKASLGSITRMLAGTFKTVVSEEQERAAKYRAERGQAPAVNGGAAAPASRFAPDAGGYAPPRIDADVPLDGGGGTPDDEDIPF